MKWREFKSMGTDIILFLVDDIEPDKLLDAAKREVAEFEQRFSRFITNNELADFNNYNGQEFKVSEMMADLLNQAKIYYQKTDTVFDPAIIGVLEKIGYDKNFANLSFKNNSSETLQNNWQKINSEFALWPKFSDVLLNGQMIKKPIGLRIDLGGIGKGYIVDYLSTTVFSKNKNFLISAGGDILAVGNQEGDIGWDVAVQNPIKPEENIFFINTLGEHLGIATSGTMNRSWKKDNLIVNHLIDPRSGLSVNNKILAVTVISVDAVKADIYAKTVLILGEEKGLEFIENESDSACIIFTISGKNIFSSRVHKYFKK